MKKVIVICLLSVLFSACLSAQVYRSDALSFKLETLLPDLSSPWSLALIESDDPGSPPREGFMSLRTGSMYFLTDIPLPGEGRKAAYQSLEGLPDFYIGGQGGLLDVILAKNFRENARIYFSASSLDEELKAGTAVYTALFNRERMRLENVENIFFLKRTGFSSIHFGSRMVIGPDDDLFFSIGERGEPDRAQNRRDAAGGITRIPLNADGLPDGVARNYSFGNRNIQGLLYDRDEDLLLAHEHGPRGGDEINLIFQNANYGWPRVSYGVNYNGSKVSNYQSLPGIVEPLIYWVPSIAPSGFALYPETGVFAPRKGEGWSGQLFVGALAGQHIRRVRLPENWQDESTWPLNEQAEEEELLRRVIGRIRDLRVDNMGHIYILTDGGALHRLIPADQ